MVKNLQMVVKRILAYIAWGIAIPFTWILIPFALLELNFFRKKPFLSAFLLGVFSGFFFAPFNLTFLIIFIIPILLLFLEERDLKTSFRLGWIFGFGQFLVGLYWIGIALTVEIERFWWLMPFAVLGLPALFALYTGLACMAYNSLRMPLLLKPFWFSALWSLGEYLRGTLFTGFPWNLTAYTWITSEVGGVSYIAQSMSLFGAYGLTFLTIFLGASLFPLAYPQKEKRKGLPFTLALGGFGLLFVYGILQTKIDPYAEKNQGPLLRLVQPNIDQKQKWNQQQARDILDKTLKLSLEPSEASQPVSFILWPESATQFYYDADPVMRELIASYAPKGGAILMGAVRFVRASQEGFKVWNSFYAVTDKGEIEGLYDKSHLVPFGEYVPLRAVIPQLVRKVTAGAVDYSSGDGVKTVTVSGLPSLSPLICFEGIFPGGVISQESERPRWMLNVTNDGWYGKSSGPYQHLQSVQARAIEEGIPVVRVANSGVSALIDKNGSLLTSIPLSTEGVLDFHLPAPAKEKTFFARYGNRLPLAMIGFFLFSCFLIGLKTRRAGIKEDGI